MPAKKHTPLDLLEKILAKRAADYLQQRLKGHERPVSKPITTGPLGLALLAAVLALRKRESRKPGNLLEEAHKLVREANWFLIDGDSAPRLHESTIYVPDPLSLHDVMRCFHYKHAKSVWKRVDKLFDGQEALEMKSRKRFTTDQVRKLISDVQEGKAVRAAKARSAKQRHAR